MLRFSIIIILFFISVSSFNQADAQTSQQIDSAKAKINQLLIDTNINKILQQIDTVKQDTVVAIDSTLLAPPTTDMTNTELFVYILLTVGGLGLFYFLFVATLFRTFHKTKSTRQSLLLSWSLFFIISVVWLYIIWGVVAGFSTSAAFIVTMIFLFIISLVMLIIAIKSK
jgi:hypothetical protein